MFDAVQKNKKLIRIVLLVLILPFAFFGLEAYTRSISRADEVASVDGNPITLREFTDQLQRQLDRLRGMFGAAFDPSIVDTPEMRKNLLESMVNQRLLMAQVQRERFRIDDETLRATISTLPPFQLEGKFSRPAYEAWLRAQGLTSPAFDAQLRNEIAMSQLTRAVGETAISSTTVAARLAALIEQKREVSESLITFSPFLAQVTIEPKQVRAYYDGNAAEFRVPERIRAEFVEFASENLATQEKVTEEELTKAWEAKAALSAGAEQRRTSHILLEVSPGASADDRKAVREKAAGILAEVLRTPARFGEIARRTSQDKLTAAKGGDLGFVSRGSTIKAVEDAAFALKEGETSGVVESEFGFHIVRVTAIQGVKPPTLESLRSELTVELQRQKVLQRFAKDAVEFGNLVYEQSDSLEPVAKRFGLRIQRSGWIDASSDASGPLGHPKLRTALFSSDSIKAKRNTDAVEVSEGRLVAARVAEHEPASTRKFEEVSAAIEEKLKGIEAAKLARKQGEEMLERLKKGESSALSFGAARNLSRKEPGGLAAAALKAIVTTDTANLPAYVGVDVPERGFAVYRISRVLPPEEKPESARREDAERLRQLTASAQFEAYVAGLRSRGDVTIRPEAIEKK